MTEEEWLACSDPEPMLRFLRGKASDRKARLFAVSCCRKIWEEMEETFRAAVEVAEQLADGRVGNRQLREIREQCKTCWGSTFERVSRKSTACYSGTLVTRSNAWTAAASVNGITSSKEFAAQNVHEFRCIFGNPFRPIIIDPRWLTSTVVDLATAIYNEKAFDRIPIMADALMDAGCDNEEIIAHCRVEGQHVRGCWAVDLILGKK